MKVHFKENFTGYRVMYSVFIISCIVAFNSLATNVIASSQTDSFSYILADFRYDRNHHNGGESDNVVFEFNGWNKVIRDRYTRFFDVGVQGLGAGRGSYNFQGIKNESGYHDFKEGEQIEVVWFNNKKESITFTPQISFQNIKYSTADKRWLGRVMDGVSYQDIGEITIKGKSTGKSIFLFDSNSQGTFSTISLKNPDNIGLAKDLLCVKIIYTNEPIDIIPLADPSNVKALARSENSIDISWEDSLDNVEVSGYKIYRNGMPVGFTKNNKYTDTDLIWNTGYQYTVSAMDDNGNESSGQLSLIYKTSNPFPDLSWQQKLENDFCGDGDPYCTVDTFDHYADWRHQKDQEMPKYLADGDSSPWKGYMADGYEQYTEDEIAPLCLTNWESDHQVGSKSFVLGNKATTLDYPGHNGPKDLCMYFGEPGNMDGSTGYDDVYVFFRIYVPSNHFPTAQEFPNTKIFKFEEKLDYINTGQKLVRLASGFTDADAYHCAAGDDPRCSEPGIIQSGNPDWTKIYIGDASTWFNISTALDDFGRKRNFSGYYQFYTSGGISDLNRPRDGLNNIKDQLGAIEMHFKAETTAGSNRENADGIAEVWSYDKYGNRKLVASGSSTIFKPYFSQQNHKFNRLCMDGHIRVNDIVDGRKQDIYFIPGSGMDTSWWLDDLIIDDKPIGERYFTLLNQESVAPETDFALKGVATGNTESVFELLDRSMRNPYKWKWEIYPSIGVQFLDGTDQESQNPKVKFQNAGSYTVTLTARNDHGEVAETKLNYINISSDSITLIDFIGEHNSYDDSQNLVNGSDEGWIVINDVYTKYYVVDGHTGSTQSSGSYDYQGIQNQTGHSINFTQDHTIMVTWYNGYDTEIKFIPQISFDDPNRRGSDYDGTDYPVKGNWYSMGRMEIAPHQTAQSLFKLDGNTAGSYNLVSVSSNFQNANYLMICDKIELLKFNGTAPSYDPCPEGVINQICDCNGTAYASGYCCQNSWQETECPVTPVSYDLNQDGVVNVQDVILCVNAILDGSSSGSADVNGDGAVNIMDVMEIVNKILSSSETG